jgi:hypothetical protein
MANGKRAQTIHATSRKRHMFKKLQEDIPEWRKNPMMYIKELKAAHKEWRPPGIREITDKPGQYLFSRAIITPAEPPKIVVPKKMLTQKQLFIPQNKIRRPANLTVGTTLTAETVEQGDTTQHPARAAPPAHPPELEFYSLENTTTGDATDGQAKQEPAPSQHNTCNNPVDPVDRTKTCLNAAPTYSTCHLKMPNRMRFRRHPKTRTPSPSSKR